MPATPPSRENSARYPCANPSKLKGLVSRERREREKERERERERKRERRGIFCMPLGPGLELELCFTLIPRPPSHLAPPGLNKNMQRGGGAGPGIGEYQK